MFLDQYFLNLTVYFLASNLLLLLQLFLGLLVIEQTFYFVSSELGSVFSILFAFCIDFKEGLLFIYKPIHLDFFTFTISYLKVLPRLRLLVLFIGSETNDNFFFFNFFTTHGFEVILCYLNLLLSALLSFIY